MTHADGEAGLGEQALSKAAEAGLSSQLQEVTEMEVDIRTNPLQLMQGNLDSVNIHGEGMVMQKSLRVEEMDIEVGSISVNPLSIAFGKIEMTHPTDAKARVVLTEDDINRSFNSEYILDKLQNIQVRVDGQPMTVDTKRVEFRIPDSERVAISADIYVHETGETKHTSFTTRLQRSDDGERISLDDVQYTEGEALLPELTAALLEKANELGNLRNFELDGMTLRLRDVELQGDRMTLQTDIHIEEFPQ